MSNNSNLEILVNDKADTPPAKVKQANASNIWSKILNFVLNNLVWFMLLVLVLVLGQIESSFFKINILKNIVIQASVLGVLSAGISFTLLTGKIDLSATGNMAVSALCGVLAMKAGLPWYLAALLILVISVSIGLFNGVMIAKLKSVPLMETLALGMLLQGVMVYVTRGVALTDFPEAYKFLGQGKIFGIEILPIVFLCLFGIVAVIWKKTVLGRSIFAVGGNAECARISGIKVDRIQIYVYMICGLFAGLAGFMLSGYVGAVTTSFGEEFQMTAMAAAVIGGVSLAGGRGRIIGVLGGVLLLTVVKVGLQVTGIDSYIISMVEGAMVLVAVLIDSIRQKYQSKM